MKIVLACAPVRTGDVTYNLQQITAAMASHRGKADVLVFGESVLQGFDCLRWEYARDRQVAVALTDPPIRQLQQAARENRIAVSFGFIRRQGECLYSSQLFLGDDGEIVDLFHRVSLGWKEYDKTDDHYREGECFHTFSYGGKTFATGLCGDLWTEGRPEEMRRLNPDIVLWPVWCDYSPQEWNGETKQEYAAQAALCGRNVLLVNPFCIDVAEDCAQGGSVWFRDGRISQELSAEKPGYLTIEI